MQPDKLIIPGISEENMHILRYNTKDYAQYVLMVKNFLSGYCPFCTIDTTINKVLYQNASWKIWESAFPQRHHALQLIILHNQHINHTKQMTPEDWVNLGEMDRWANAHFDIPGGGFAARIGTPELNACSVPGHLHWNIQVPDGTGRVSVVLHKTEEEMEEQLKRALVYEKIRLGTTYEDLNFEEIKLIKGRYPSLSY